MNDLRNFNIFKEFSDELLSDLFAVMVEKEFEKNEVIFEEGDAGDALYRVKAGEVAIRKLAVKLSGVEKTIAMIDEGDFFEFLKFFQ